MPVGQPTKYTTEKGEMICELIATSNKSMKTICEETGIPYGTHLSWLRDNEEYSLLYARAKEDQADFMADEMLAISDDSSNDVLFVDEHGNKVENKEFVNRSKLRIDTRKWLASKLKSKRYGDKVDVTSAGDKLPTDLKVEIVLPKDDADE